MRIVVNKNPPGNVFINKLAAAERQLSSAIRMYLLEEDPLSIHTVAAASYNVFADLQKKRGKDEWSWAIEYGFLRAALDLGNGFIRDGLRERLGEAGLRILEEISTNLKTLGVETIDELEGLRLHGLPDEIRNAWYENRKSANYLKHADNDPQKLLSLDDLNNEDLIFRSIASSMFLNLPLENEREFFYSMMYALGLIDSPPSQPYLIWILMAQTRKEVMELGRKNFCYRRFPRIELRQSPELAKEALELQRRYYPDSGDW